MWYAGMPLILLFAFILSKQDRIGRDLVKASEDALQAGIDACGPGRHFRDIAKAIHSTLKGKDYTICPGFTGHGIGQAFHRPPWILHDGVYKMLVDKLILKIPQ